MINMFVCVLCVFFCFYRVFVNPSDGAGRSGVYIAIDANIELCEEDGVFDVYGYLKKMRGLRRGLVETLVGLYSSLWGRLGVDCITTRRSFLVPTHLVPTHFVATCCQLLLQFTLNLLKIGTSFL